MTGGGVNGDDHHGAQVEMPAAAKKYRCTTYTPRRRGNGTPAKGRCLKDLDLNGSQRQPKKYRCTTYTPAGPLSPDRVLSSCCRFPTRSLSKRPRRGVPVLGRRRITSASRPIVVRSSAEKLTSSLTARTAATAPLADMPKFAASISTLAIQQIFTSSIATPEFESYAHLPP
jgi:hypothetical protein